MKEQLCSIIEVALLLLLWRKLIPDETRGSVTNDASNSPEASPKAPPHSCLPEKAPYVTSFSVSVILSKPKLQYSHIIMYTYSTTL